MATIYGVNCVNELIEDLNGGLNPTVAIRQVGRLFSDGYIGTAELSKFFDTPQMRALMPDKAPKKKPERIYSVEEIDAGLDD